MNLGDGLLFELENGKPKLILLSHVEKNSKKLSLRPRAANILGPRQLSCVEEVQEKQPVRHEAKRQREGRSKAEPDAISFSSNSVSNGGSNAILRLSKTHENNKGGSNKTAAKVKSEGRKQTANERSKGKTEQCQKIVTQLNGNDQLANGTTGHKDSVVCLTNEQLQQILNTVQASSNGCQLPEHHREEGNQTVSKNGRGGQMKQEDSGGGQETKKGEGGVTDISKSSLEKDRLSGCLFRWLEERGSDSRTTIDAKNAQWRRELDEQVALKQQQGSAPGRLQVEDRDSVLSVQSSVSHREQPAAIKSSLKLGDVTPMEEMLSVEKREEQRRRWLEELDRQREEMTVRRKREKLLQSQTEDHELWAAHFDSLWRRPPVLTDAPSAPPPAPSNGSERGEWEPSSSLSLVWEATSSCGAESVEASSVDTSSRYQNKASHLRTMTALLDPAQVEERERRRVKQLEQQRAIEAQLEERRQQREQENAKRRKEEEEEERRVALEREKMKTQYELDSVRERQKEQVNHHVEQLKKQHSDKRLQEKLEPSAVTKPDGLEKRFSNSVSPYRDMAVQTEAASGFPLTPESLQAIAKNQAPPSQTSAPLNSRNRATNTGKENICMQGEEKGQRQGEGGGGDPYEAFARTDRSRKDKRRPEWNTQRPSRRFVPASERYPASLQRNRQESRLKRQAELLALQERACLSRAEPPPQNQEPRLCSNPKPSPNSRVESVSRGQNISGAVSAERGRSPPVPAFRNRAQSEQTCTPPPALEFIPYLRTDEVFNLDPLEPANTPPLVTHRGGPSQSSAAPSSQDPLIHPELLRNTHTHRQQEILRGLAQLRQGLLQKQRELETDLNPLLKHHDTELRTCSATRRM